MWSNSSGVNNISSSKAISSSSLLSTSSSSTWTKSSSSPIPTTTRKSMEDVWEDITQSSLHHHPTTAFHGMTLQDFLARTLNEDPLTSRVDYYSRQPSSSAGGGGPPPRTTTVLSLTSSADHLMRASNPQLKDGGSSVGMASFKSPLDSSFSKKRPPENDHNSIDRKDKRLIKNRESAERSRARKQAYIYELEQEVAHLVEENANLRKEVHKKSCLAETAPPQLPKKQSLTRSLTAPF